MTQRLMQKYGLEAHNLQATDIHNRFADRATGLYYTYEYVVPEDDDEDEIGEWFRDTPETTYNIIYTMGQQIVPLPSIFCCRCFKNNMKSCHMYDGGHLCSECVMICKNADNLEEELSFMMQDMFY